MVLKYSSGQPAASQSAGVHSRRRAADELGVEDPEAEFRRWLEEQQAVGS